jgi:hypothetical protein
MRYHELAMQAWLYSRFFVRDGYPVPVVFGTPMDAFSKFQDLWKLDKNPFSFLLNVKDDKGTPLYEPYPSAPRYPLISVMRKGWKFRTYQNSSIHFWRHINWPTVSKDVHREDLGSVTTSFMPMAWDYKFQIDYFSMRPDTQAFFIETMMRQFWRTGGTPQTWIKVNYPGIGSHLVRVYLPDEGIDWVTPDVPESDKIMEYRTSVTVVLEGFSVDLGFVIQPTLWKLVIGEGTASVDELNELAPLDTVDLRIGNANPTMLSRTNIPANGTGTVPVFGVPSNQIVSLGTGTPDTADPSYLSPAAYAYGIVSGEAFGTPTIVQT